MKRSVAYGMTVLRADAGLSHQSMIVFETSANCNVRDITNPKVDENSPDSPSLRKLLRRVCLLSVSVTVGVDGYQQGCERLTSWLVGVYSPTLRLQQLNTSLVVDQTSGPTADLRVHGRLQKDMQVEVYDSWMQRGHTGRRPDVGRMRRVRT